MIIFAFNTRKTILVIKITNNESVRLRKINPKNVIKNCVYKKMCLQKNDYNYLA